MSQYIDRREYLQAMGVSLSSAGIAGTAVASSTTNQVTLSGQLKSFRGNAISGRKIYITGDGYIDTDESGYFETEVPADSYMSVGLYKSGHGQLHAPVQNGVPHVDKIDSVRTGSSDIDLGTVNIDRGYLVNLRALDTNDSPVTDAEFGFRGDGFGSSDRLLSANSDGFMVINNADFTGVELTESAKVSIKIPDGSAMMEYEKDLYVSSPMTITARKGEGLTVEEHGSEDSPETTTAKETTTAEETTTSPTSSQTSATTDTQTSTTSSSSHTTTSATTSSPTTTSGTTGKETTTERNRGFLSNGESVEEYEFLTDPLFLTVGGFVLSVAGIAQNLIRGR